MMTNKLNVQLAALLLASGVGMTSGTVSAQQSIMVAGDSISAGFGRPSYRLPLLDALNGYGCDVLMVGDQTLNDFNFRQPVGPNNGSHFPGFSPPAYDTDHQAFPGITTDQLAFGVSSAHYTVQPIANYVSSTQPDYVLVHLGSNDIGAAIVDNRLTTDAEINTWANTTVDEMRDVINEIISVHNQPANLRILVANFIPYAADNRTAAQLARAKRASELFTSRLESMVLDRADSKVLIVDVEAGFDPAGMTYDGLHPNAVGEEHLAGAFLPVLRGAGLCPNTPMVTTPAVGSTVNGESTVVRWVNNGLPVSGWRLRVGESQSGSSSTYFDSGDLAGNARSVIVTGLPANQSNLFVSLQYTSGGVTDQVLSSFINLTDSNDPALPDMVSPLPGSALTGSSVNFTWESNDTFAYQWYVRIGSTPGAADYFDSQRITDESTRSVSVSGLPTDGSTVYVELNARPAVDPWLTRIFTYRAAGGGMPDKVLQSGEWYQISLPYNPGSNNRVRDVFGGALPVNDYAAVGNNGSWVVFAYDLHPTNQLNDNYRRLTINDAIEVGKGYWIQHNLPNPVTLSAPSGASENSNNVPGSLQAACANPDHCYAMPVDAAVVIPGRPARWTLLGYPLSNPTTPLKLRVGTDNNIGCSGTRDCSLTEAFANNLLLNIIYVQNPDAGAYDAIGPLDGLLQPWDGFWAAQASGAAGQNATLIVSEPES